MWQRFQTVFLALVVIIMLASLFFPLWINIDGDGIRYELYPLHFSITNGDQKDSAYYPYALSAVLMIAAATVSAQALRRFDNRLTQMKLTALNTFLLLGVMACFYFFGKKLSEEYQYLGYSRGAMWAIFAAVASNWIAMRLIRRDEKIVRDSERLR
jgi:cellobiose-specific phosphotransferase system component IIC